MEKINFTHRKKILLFPLLLSLIALLYWPGLSGGYVFDDEGNITSNSRLAITTLEVPELNAAAWSGNSGPLGRPVSMLSFALNHYFTGFDPYYFKLTNLFLHLFNTVLVGALAYCLLSGFLKQRRVPENLLKNPNFPLQGALIAAAFWGAHPLNLTSVLYVVQRMTSLSTLFGLMALTLYAAVRVLPIRYTIGRILALAGMLALLLTASVFSKESGVLFVPLLAFMELVVFQGMKNGTPLYIGRLSYRHLIWGGLRRGRAGRPLETARLHAPREFLCSGFHVGRAADDRGSRALLLPAPLFCPFPLGTGALP